MPTARRQTRSVLTDAKLKSKQPPKAERTKKQINASKSPSTPTRGKSTKDSPVKKQSSSIQNASPKRSHTRPAASSRPLRTPQKSPIKSPIKNVNSVNGMQGAEATAKKVTCGAPTTVIKRNARTQKPMSKSSEVGEKIVQIKTSPKSPSKTAASKIAGTKSTSMSYELSPAQPRTTRGSSAGRSPSSSSLSGPLLIATPTKSSNRTQRSPTKQSTPEALKSQSPATRKRNISSPCESPQSPKAKRLKGKVLIPVQLSKNLKEELNNGEESSLKEGDKLIDLPMEVQKHEPVVTKQEDVLPELNGRFLQRKWFSLKARGGFTCLRSAILTREEIAQEVLQKTSVDPTQHSDVNFFTTKLMVRLSSKLPPVRARPSCEELVAKQNPNTLDDQTDPKVEGTAIRVKVERRSFKDTVSHLKSEPAKSRAKPNSPIKSSLASQIVSTFVRNPKLTKKQERDIALKQLKNLGKL